MRFAFMFCTYVCKDNNVYADDHPINGDIVIPIHMIHQKIMKVDVQTFIDKLMEQIHF